MDSLPEQSAVIARSSAMMVHSSRYSTHRKRLNPWVLALIALVHLVLFYGLIRALAPNAVATAEDTIVSAFTVTVTAPEEPEDQDTEPEGAQSAAGVEAVAAPVSAPTPAIPAPQDRTVPPVASTGSADTSGAADSGTGTGADGEGVGTGSGEQGMGSGSGAATKPEIISGALNSARDFPVPPGGREARIGTSVIVKVIVQPNGRATDCSIYRASPFPETDRATCRLVMQRLRFRPATNAAGEPVAAPFYYRQRFF